MYNKYKSYYKCHSKNTSDNNESVNKKKVWFSWERLVNLSSGGDL